MDVEIAIRYSDDRPCLLTISKPDGEVIYRIVTPHAAIPASLAEGLREAQRLFNAAPWAGRTPH